MLPRHRLWLGATVAALAIVAATLFIRPAEPTCEGRSLSAWLQDLLDPMKRSQAETTRAVQAIGTDALPHLMSMFTRRDSRLRPLLVRVTNEEWMNELWPPAEQDHFLAAAGFSMLGPNAAPVLPRLRELMDSGTMADQVRTLDVMRYLGPAAAGDIAAALGHRNPELRIAALSTLSTNQFSARELVALLEARTQDSDPRVRTGLYSWLSRRQIPPGHALPLLEKGFNDVHPSPRSTACDTVGLFGPLASNALPALERLAAGDENSSVRQAARTAATRIKGDSAGREAAPAGTR